jgi:hypothetical protein
MHMSAIFAQPPPFKLNLEVLPSALFWQSIRTTALSCPSQPTVDARWAPICVAATREITLKCIFLIFSHLPIPKIENILPSFWHRPQKVSRKGAESSSPHKGHHVHTDVVFSAFILP